MEYKDYMKMAEDMLEYAYAPYSNVRVGCVLLAEDGRYYTGVNVENASFGATICAERTAVTKAVSEGNTKFKTIFVTSNLEKTITPCGICRQFILEFAPNIEFVLGTSEKFKSYSVDEMLPNAFSKDDM